MTIIYSPPNELLHIDDLWLFVSIDDKGNEGVCAAPLAGPGSLVPLVAADEARLKSLLPVARQIARGSGKTVKLIKFSTRSEIMAIAPDGMTQ
jgi:hypothetical protein